MNSHRLRKPASFFFLCLVFFLSFSPFASARQKAAPGDRGDEASASQAQATMASLFGRGAKMPGIPRINGTIALPAFDSRGMKIDESALRLAERGERSSENGERNS
jgi:hypothetical protein